VDFGCGARLAGIELESSELGEQRVDPEPAAVLEPRDEAIRLLELG
jgi:hypothetical protein